jgi:GNAT superfamily N-acetyltransferase
MTATVRPATAADTAAIARIALERGQPEVGSGADAEYVSHLLDCGDLVVVESGGDVAAFGATVPLGDVLLLSDLFVASTVEGRGVGRLILDVLFRNGVRRVTFSSQHPRAVPLYERFGLEPRWRLLYLEGARGDVPAAAGVAAAAVDAGEAAAAERALTGHDRTAAYGYWTRRGHGLVVRDNRGDVVAAGASDGAALAHLAVASEAPAADAVVAALRLFGRGRLMLALPEPHPAAAILAARGFDVVDYDIFMSTPGDELPVRNVYSPGLG